MYFHKVFPTVRLPDGVVMANGIFLTGPRVCSWLGSVFLKVKVSSHGPSFDLATVESNYEYSFRLPCVHCSPQKISSSAIREHEKPLPCGTGFFKLGLPPPPTPSHIAMGTNHTNLQVRWTARNKYITDFDRHLVWKDRTFQSAACLKGRGADCQSVN